MSAPGCPRCAGDLVAAAGSWRCAEHGDVPRLLRADEVTYAGLLDHLAGAGAGDTAAGADPLPTLLAAPPASPRWAVVDLARAVGPSGTTVATLACSRAPDGAGRGGAGVETLAVLEEPGVGLGARCAGLGEHAPGADLAAAPPATRARVGAQSVPLWALSPTAGADVLVGEHRGCWLWLVLRHAGADAPVLLREEWVLEDAAALGPLLVEVPFAAPRPLW